AALAGLAATGGDGLALAAFGYGDRSGGFHPVPKRLRGPVDRRADSRIAGGGAAVSGALGAAHRWRWQVRALGFHDARNNGLAGAGNATRGIETAAIITGAPGPRLKITAAGFHRRRLFRNRFVAVLDEERSLTRPVLDQFRVPGRASGGNLDLVWTPAGPLARLTVGIDGERRTGATHERFRNLGDGFTRRRLAGGATTRLGGYLEAALVPLSGWTVTASLRADGWRIGPGREVIAALSTGAVLEETRAPARHGAVVTGGLTATGPIAPGLRLHLSARRGWRLPTLNELFRPFRVGNTATRANAGLAPERLEAVQIVLASPRDALITWRLGGHLGRLVDGIGNVTIGSGPGRFPSVGFLPADGILRERRNIPRIRLAGADFRIAIRPWRQGELVAAGLFRDERITRAPAVAPALAGRRVAQVPRFSARIAFTQDVGRRLSLSLHLNHLGRAFEDDRASLVLAGATVVGAGLVWRPRPHWRLILTAENIFDRTVMNRIAPDGLITRARPARLLLRLAWRS
ncbi:MAG: TonB-dependent receptor, partial [Alphaproteobacteria bacterium]